FRFEQLLKYQQRYGFSHRDALRLFHNAPATPEHQTLYNWVTHGWQSLPDAPPSDALSQLWWYEWVKLHPDQACHAITQGGLTHEMVAPVAQMTQQAWQKLFEKMPIRALLRNLGSLTEIGVLGPRRRKNLERVAQVLVNRQHLRRGRIHPIDVLKALKTYESGGRLGRSKKTWRPVGKILNILEQALALSFEIAEPTGKTFLHALDISGSMNYYTVGSIGLSCCEIATTMALATAKAETKGYIRGFSTEFKNLGITANDSFVSAIRKASDQNFGGTDASVAYQWAIRKRVNIDVFCFWTDSESWSGNQHPSQALKTYRQRVNSKAQAIYVTLAPYQLTLVDPQDPLSWDFGGFDPSVPRAIQAIATGEFQGDR
ncbi:MAG: TROVE domain-containing protein, partial [Cyanobacteria bacterium P01_H01_bin.15]